MSYIAAVDHLYALGHELTQPSPTAPRRKFDLAHMRALMAALGDPQNTFPSVLIAGTNGKGSTASTLASILTAAGYRTALYTSPHLIRVNERIQIDGIQISDEDFARLYFQVDDAANRLVFEGALPHHPSFFEVLTALAFLYFAGQAEDSASDSAPEAPSALRVAVAVLEVGLGGRLDATNIVEPLLSIITDIALDHQDYLGDTIAAITREKAGILRANGTLITLPQHPEANQAIGEAAATLNLTAISAAPFVPPTRVPAAQQPGAPRLDSETWVSEAPQTLPPNHYTLTLDHQPLEINSPLHGQHQQRNIALAIAAAVALRNQISYKSNTTSNQTSYKITNTAIEAGIRNTSWPGRLELIPGHPPLLLDVAHNPAGAWTLRAAIAQLPSAQPRTLIFSCLRDKSLKEMSQILLPLFDSNSGDPDRVRDHVLLAPIDNPRAASLSDLLAAAHALDIPAHAAPHIAAALAEARAVTPPDGIIIATGSVYLVGEVRNLALTSGDSPA
ncbi:MULTISPECIES: folylpolyglutamate synthase/dihydrofolate synthase family protein [Acidobacteriaceae]|uniref:bifunctional folylpolyglutamate synthase/dihydrofolate synthase n=1 Tax=Acidobacteriaceae TaxID=204434 RepID=UPI00131E418E|nr:MULTISPECIES: folylpolyglutamate synthase/dihydrofolate synthase family protein [Acidobacteriaceae]MDW5265628.1 folylpolyglutamate synthase/dihydrofolate synthase family protein [Edaphobacter sp.]